jgi:hypothetical protein
MFPPTLSWLVRSMRTPVGEQPRELAVHDGGADLDLMSSPMIGRPASVKRLSQ